MQQPDWSNCYNHGTSIPVFVLEYLWYYSATGDVVGVVYTCIIINSLCTQFNDNPEEVFLVDGAAYSTTEIKRFCDILSYMCDNNGKRYSGGGYGGANPFFNAAGMIGNTKVAGLTSKQISFRKDVTIWLEMSSTSATYLVTDDKRFSQTFENKYI